jgi:hypothetical protein
MIGCPITSGIYEGCDTRRRRHRSHVGLLFGECRSRSHCSSSGSRLWRIELRKLTGIQYDQRMQGTLQLFRTQRQFDAIGKDVEVLRAGGVSFEIMGRDRCIQVGPGLRPVAMHVRRGTSVGRVEVLCYNIIGQK